ncbi:hypothetical protein [Salisediminibacterium beveridgei]|uniref:Uncharacterized protein n=1 Tax=Salisediminibacterium beveridgei TaxID=632773 RepID=A0A1D7QRU4_9BACI|nr:hypothetical protein [Salisediminibacterium beveridgei]AOM81711.1 hypothetical protein BBEV_0317 [Salisediminibacterium beveridgei]
MIYDFLMKVRELITLMPLYLSGAVLLASFFPVMLTYAGEESIYTPFVSVLLVIIAMALWDQTENTPLSFACIGFLLVFLPLSRMVNADTAVLAGAIVSLFVYIMAEKNNWEVESAVTALVTLMMMGLFTERLPGDEYHDTFFDFFAFSTYETLSLAMVSSYFYLPVLSGMIMQLMITRMDRLLPVSRDDENQGKTPKSEFNSHESKQFDHSPAAVYKFKEYDNKRNKHQKQTDADEKNQFRTPESKPEESPDDHDDSFF